MKFRITSEFGAIEEIRGGRIHNGVDIAINEGSPLYSATDGVVSDVIDCGTEGIGKAVHVQNSGGETFIYGHMKDIDVVKGHVIEKGDIIGESGNTGFSSGPHLHFSMKDSGGDFINPMNYIDSAVEPSRAGSFLDFFFQPITEGVGDSIHSLGSYLFSILPEIGGFLVIVAGVLMMATGNVSKYGGYLLTAIFTIIAIMIGGEL